MNIDDQGRSGWPKTEYSEALLQTIGENPMDSTQWVSGKLGISQSSVFHHLHDLDKNIQNCQIVPHVLRK